ncbi:Poly(A)-specific ribonuclease PARN-like domain-containing protein 1 [Exaiptasia diaphana]|nr:Poly(A)-specific ribonuclease PARN-like domain-containing protein 1 [Exaiptasia diaphana]
MCEILRSNFEECFHEIEDVIKKSSFVAIDAEFTGLSLNDSSVYSLFDNASTRYKKLKKSVSQFVISQFGLCAFVENTEELNRYTAYTYNFYLFQPSFGPVDCRFLCQTSSLEFLCQNKFNFNKFIHEGVPYLNKEEEKEIKTQHENHTLHCNMTSYKLGDLDEEIKAEIAKTDLWLQSAKEGDEMTFNSENYIKQYMLLIELKNQFKHRNINCKVQDGFRIVITKKCSSDENIESKFQKEVGRLIHNQCENQDIRKWGTCYAAEQ